jgi:hypothetical protein
MDPGGLSKDKKQVASDGKTIGHMSDTTDYIIEQLFPYKWSAQKRPSDRSEMLNYLHD